MITDQRTLRRALRDRFPRDHGQLLPALHFLHEQFGHLPDWGMEVVGWHLGMPASEVYGAATSYTELRIDKPGAHVLRVCTGLPCWQQGGRDIASAVSDDLGLPSGQTTTDGAITFEEVECGFLCGVAPAVEFDHRWHGRATVESVRALIAGARQ